MDCKEITFIAAIIAAIIATTFEIPITSKYTTYLTEFIYGKLIRNIKTINVQMLY